MFDVLETFLGRTKFVATDYVCTLDRSTYVQYYHRYILISDSTHSSSQMTIADVSVVATVSTINIILPVDAVKWPKLGAWFDRMRVRPAYRERNVPGLRRLRAIVASVAKFELPPDAEFERISQGED